MHTQKHSRAARDRQAMREANKLPQTSLVDIDPEDPSQLLDDAGQFSVIDIGVNLDAQPQAEADAELDAALAEAAGEEGSYEEESVELDTPSETTADAYAAAADDTGELYGVHLPTPADKNDIDVNPDGESFKDSELGEHAFETLGKKMTEGGADPERDIDVVDNSDGDRGHSSTDRKDRPVADKGSGGEGGL